MHARFTRSVRHLAAAGTAVLCLSAVACSQSRAASGGTGTVSASPMTPAHLSWGGCTEPVPRLQCAALKVPIDWSKPDGDSLDLRLARILAVSPQPAAPSILEIPGGPGAGVAEVLSFGKALHLDEWTEHHDVYLFDPRGIGESHAVRCAEPDPFPPGILTSQAQVDRWAQVNRAFAESCEAVTGSLMRHLSSADTARDIEAIRLAIGQRVGLVAYAASYGSSYAVAYLELGHPARALILDGVIDHSVPLTSFAERVALAQEDSFDRFVQWCASTPDCALHGQDAGTVFDQLIAAPLAAPQAARPATALEVRARNSSLLSGGPRFAWPKAAALMAQALAGDASAFVAGPTGTGLFQGVICGDFTVPRDFGQLAGPVPGLRRNAPRLGEWKYWDVVGGCLGYRPAVDPPHRLRMHSPRAVLVGSNAHDPATPLVNALAVWGQIPHAKLLIADADGHQALVMSPCAAAAFVRFIDAPDRQPASTRCDT